MRLIIFGTGNAGRAIYRKLINDKKYTVICFIDNNSKLNKNLYGNTIINSVNAVKEIDFDYVVVGGVWLSQMNEQLLSLGVPQNKIWHFKESEIVYNSLEREKATDIAVEELVSILNKNNIDYLIDGSSLLTLMRKESLSQVSDVDVVLMDFNNLEVVYRLLNNSKRFFKYKINKLLYSDDHIVRKKKEISKIIISSNHDSVKSEPLTIDISAYSFIDDYATLDYGKQLFYFPKRLVEKNKELKYKNISLKIPSNYDGYLSSVYGENWIQVPEKWSTEDYKNLVNKSEFEEIIRKNNV